MSKAWKTVRLGEVLRRSEEVATVDALTEYREITVRLWGKGVVERGRVSGANLNGRRFIARQDQFIASRIDARNGAMGIVPQALDGALVTNDFPLFDVIPERLLVRFLGWLCQTRGFVDLCLRASEGTTNRVRLKEEEFLALEIPLPPLSEQRRIVARIEELATVTETARRLRAEAVEEGEVLCRAILACDSEATPTPMRELVRMRTPDVEVNADDAYQFAGVYCFGRGAFRGQLKSGLEFAYRRLTRLHAGDFVYPKLMAWEGALAVVPAECDGCVVSPEFPVFEILENRVFHEVLDTHFRTPSVWPDIAGASTGTNVRRRRLNPEDFLDYQIPLPTRKTQARLRAVRTEIDSLRTMQAATAGGLDALLPSILDRAFRGEL